MKGNELIGLNYNKLFKKKFYQKILCYLPSVRLLDKLFNSFNTSLSHSIQQHLILLHLEFTK